MNNKYLHNLPYLFILLLIAVMVAACSEAPVTSPPVLETQSIQPATIATEASSSEPEITPTATPEADPRNQLGSSVWGAVFEDNTETWYQFDNDMAKSEVREGKLVLTAKKANSFDSWTMSYPPMSDFYLEVVFSPGEPCQGKDRYGILFRAPDNTQGYLFNVACDGSYQLRIWDGEGFTDLANWTVDPKIAAGAVETQRLGVWAEGDRLQLYVNGFQVGEVSDSTYSEGTFGVNIAGAETEGFTVDVVEAKAWELTY
ncbi:MAG: DUF1080 domain-containing protein [Chloroflexota bacterium]|nr:MAG: DUF1080 domain-containing protein [Chloroflexota bacterium]